MELKKTGGQAFPTSDGQAAHSIAVAALSGIEDSAERDRVYSEVRAQAMQGMTLRDYFAAAALPALITAGVSTEYDAREAYRAADRMLAAREEA